MKGKCIVASAIAATLALTPLVGCAAGTSSSSGSVADSSSNSQSASSSEGTEMVAGGWAINADAKGSLTDEERQVFEKAVAEYDGVKLEPVALLGSQVVAGANYAYLCKMTPVTADPSTSWAIVVVYRDLEGNASITSVKDVVLTDYV